jgi:plasmid stabilization system protein ParE
VKRWSFSPEANADLEEIWTYWFMEADEVTSDRIEAEIYEASDLLAGHPMLGNLKSEWTRRSVRFWLVGNYWVAYVTGYSRSTHLNLVRDCQWRAGSIVPMR